MKLLLDTHVWLWSTLKPDRLNRAALREIDRRENQIYLSPVSIWEAHCLVRRKRFDAKPDFTTWIASMLLATPFIEAPFSFAAAAEIHRIHLPQADPGDVFLAATAVALDLTLVTADSQLLACKWLKTLRAD